MLPDRVSNPGPLTYESDALPIALRGPARLKNIICRLHDIISQGTMCLKVSMIFISCCYGTLFKSQNYSQNTYTITLKCLYPSIHEEHIH